MLPNGNLFSNERSEVRKGVALTASGRLAEYDASGGVVWSHMDPYQHHDARRLGEGAVYAAFSELSEAEKRAVIGGIPGSETEGGPYGEVIREVNEEGETVWDWNFLSLGPDTHPLHRNSNRWSYGHTNTVCPLADGNYLVNSKNMNLLFIVERPTGRVVWEFQDDALGGQHDAQMLDNGNILVFANGAYAAVNKHPIMTPNRRAKMTPRRGGFFRVGRVVAAGVSGGGAGGFFWMGCSGAGESPGALLQGRQARPDHDPARADGDRRRAADRLRSRSGQPLSKRHVEVLRRRQGSRQPSAKEALH